MKQTPASQPLEVRPILDENGEVIFAGQVVNVGDVIDVPDEVIVTVDPDGNETRTTSPRLLAGFTPVEDPAAAAPSKPAKVTTAPAAPADPTPTPAPAGDTPTSDPSPSTP